MDYVKISKNERDRADRLAKSAAGAALEADVQGEQSSSSSSFSHKTFVPGEGLSAEASFVTSFTAEEKAQIRELVANASSPAEIEEIEQSVQRGILPPQLSLSLLQAGSNNRKRPPPTEALPPTVENGVASPVDAPAPLDDDPPSKKIRTEESSGE